MANPEHLELLRMGVQQWNRLRKEINIIIDLSGANLEGANLINADFTGVYLVNTKLVRANLLGVNFSGADLVKVDLSGANLSNSNLSKAHLFKANLSHAHLFNADLTGANLKDAKLVNAKLSEANLSEANLSGCDFSGANLSRANLSSANLTGATFKNCIIGKTLFGYNNLSSVRDLETVRHWFPSIIGIDTLYLSKGKISEVFLKGCGVPDDLITYLPSLVGSEQVIQFYSCFISYNTQDEEFAKRLYSRMRDEKLRVWFAPEDMKGGKKIVEQIENAIQVHDRLLLVLSESSMKSKWVVNEIRRARKTEEKEGRRKLFPIRLVDYKNIENWEHIASNGEDIAEEIRSYFIPDFSNWKDHDAFETAFARLLMDLKAEEKVI
jgi:hypothetical protein